MRTTGSVGSMGLEGGFWVYGIKSGFKNRSRLKCMAMSEPSRAFLRSMIGDFENGVEVL